VTAAEGPGDEVAGTEPPGTATPDPVQGPVTRSGSFPVAVLPGPDGGRPGAGRHARPPRSAGYYVRALGRRVRAQAALSAVLLVVAIAFVRIGLQHWREGTTELGLALLLAAALRAALPDRTAGLLTVRPRRVDVATYAVFGLVVILVSLTITGGPLASR
jgi:DUF3017 family protein